MVGIVANPRRNGNFALAGRCACNCIDYVGYNVPHCYLTMMQVPFCV